VRLARLLLVLAVPLVGILLVAAFALPARKDVLGGKGAPDALRLVPVVTSGLESPLHLTAAPGEPGRLYVVEQGGRIRVIEDGRLLEEPFLDIGRLVQSGGEQGLLSVAFHPGYARNHRFYVNYTDVNGDTRVIEYRSSGGRALAGSARQLLFLDQPYPNHNGGLVAFGPDGALYVGMGDGGSGGDPEDRAQNMRSRFGKLLRIDPLRPTRVKIAALGLRNPWRFSFDRTSGDLYIGDVGQGSWEEIDYLPRMRLGALQNYGWDIFEGRMRFEDTPRGPGRLVAPIAVYENGTSGCSVTGGFVYRGTAVASARGRYFYGDYCSGTVWSLRVVGGRARTLRREPFRVGELSSFGEDARGELYVVSIAGRIYRLADQG
jgi:glucose/arabinose dehydrogenase